MYVWAQVSWSRPANHEGSSWSQASKRCTASSVRVVVWLHRVFEEVAADSFTVVTDLKKKKSNILYTQKNSVLNINVFQQISNEKWFLKIFVPQN